MRRLLLAFVWVILCLTVDPGASSAQQSDQVYRIGWLQVGRPGLEPIPLEKWAGPSAAFRDALRSSGKNIVIDMRNAQGDVARLRAEAEALVASKVDVIASLGTPSTIAAMQATKVIPIVFPGVGYPVEKGIVTSLSKPGGNVTGIAVNIESAKMWQLMREMAPAARHAGYLSNLLNSYALQNATGMRANALLERRRDAAVVGFDFTDLGVKAADEIDAKFAELASRGDAVVYIASDDTVFDWRTTVMQAASRYRLVTACTQDFRWGEAGCLLTYGEDPYDRYRRAGEQVVKILRGVRPANIPVELPTKFKLIVNAKTAKALDLTVPRSLLVLADEVIE